MHQNTRSRYAIPEKRARQIPVQSYDTPIYTWHSHIHTKSQLGYYTLPRNKDVTANIHFSCLLQRSTPYAVTDSLCSPEDGHNDAQNMLRQELIINVWLLHLVGFSLFSNKNVCFDFLYNSCLQHFSFWEEFREILSQIYTALRVQCLLFMSFF